MILISLNFIACSSGGGGGENAPAADNDDGGDGGDGGDNGDGEAMPCTDLSIPDDFIIIVKYLGGPADVRTMGAKHAFFLYRKYATAPYSATAGFFDLSNNSYGGTLSLGVGEHFGSVEVELMASGVTVVTMEVNPPNSTDGAQNATTFPVNFVGEGVSNPYWTSGNNCTDANEYWRWNSSDTDLNKCLLVSTFPCHKDFKDYINEKLSDFGYTGTDTL